MTLKKNLFYLTLTIIGLSACQNKQAQVGAPINNYGDDTLNYKIAKAYVKNYEKRAGFVDSIYKSGTDVNKVKKNPDTRAIWFDIKRLKALVDTIKAEGGDGIRFYLATYDSTYAKTFKGHIPDRKYWGYNTLVMVSTKDSVDKTDTTKRFHQDYYSNGSVKNKKPKGIIVGATPENRGEMCPPPHNCKVIGATLIP